MSDDIEVSLRRFDYNVGRLETEESGISYVEEESTSFTAVEKGYTEVPDILAFLQNETQLTCITLIKILKKSDTLRDFKRNQQEYMTSVARIINSNK